MGITGQMSALRMHLALCIHDPGARSMAIIFRPHCFQQGLSDVCEWGSSATAHLQQTPRVVQACREGRHSKASALILQILCQTRRMKQIDSELLGLDILKESKVIAEGHNRRKQTRWTLTEPFRVYFREHRRDFCGLFGSTGTKRFETLEEIKESLNIPPARNRNFLLTPKHKS